MSIIIEPKPVEQALIPRNDYPAIRGLLDRLGIKVLKRTIQSDNYEADVEGWKLAEVLAEFANIKSRGNLERNDFHWITTFESIDGYDTSGTITLGFNVVELLTGALTTNLAYVVKNPSLNFNELSWDKDRKMRTRVRFFNNASQTIWLVTGASATSRHIGFKVVDAILYGTVADGTTESTLNCGTAGIASAGVALEVRFKTGVSAEFFVDGISKGTIITNLPSGLGLANNMINFTIITNEDVAKKITLSFYELWQSV